MGKAMDLQPEDPDALIEFGKEFLDKGENETAMFYFNSAKKKLSIEDTEAYEKIILTLLEHDLPEKAVPFINTIAKERPDFYNNLGLAYRRKNKLKRGYRGL